MNRTCFATGLELSTGSLFWGIKFYNHAIMLWTFNLLDILFTLKLWRTTEIAGTHVQISLRYVVVVLLRFRLGSFYVRSRRDLYFRTLSSYSTVKSNCLLEWLFTTHSYCRSQDISDATMLKLFGIVFANVSESVFFVFHIVTSKSLPCGISINFKFVLHKCNMGNVCRKMRYQPLCHNNNAKLLHIPDSLWQLHANDFDKEKKKTRKKKRRRESERLTRRSAVRK